MWEQPKTPLLHNDECSKQNPGQPRGSKSQTNERSSPRRRGPRGHPSARGGRVAVGWGGGRSQGGSFTDGKEGQGAGLQLGGQLREEASFLFPPNSRRQRSVYVVSLAEYEPDFLLWNHGEHGDSSQSWSSPTSTLPTILHALGRGHFENWGGVGRQEGRSR